MKNNIIFVPNELKLLLFISKKEYIFNVDNYVINNKIINDNIDWDYFIKLMQLNGLTLIVYYVISKIKDKKIVPDWVIEKIKYEYNNKKFKIIKLSLEVKNICKLLEENNIQFFILKGLPLAFSIYNKLTLRESSDIDLYVNKKCVLKTIELLQREGYKPATNEYKEVLNEVKKNNSKVLFEYHHIEFINIKNNIIIEMHWKLGKEYFFINTNEIFKFKNLWENRIQFELFNIKINKLSVEDEMIYLTYHAETHYFMKLKWLLDIYELINGYEKGEMKKLVAKFKKYGLLKLLAQALVLCEVYLDLNIDKILNYIDDNELYKIMNSKRILKNTYYITRFISFKFND
ncbi:MAG: nucleotidyltransferase family protein, partial [Clostridium sp.]|nr:nucleotidyltransferase family protein [Clostridium sp.]